MLSRKVAGCGNSVVGAGVWSVSTLEILGLLLGGTSGVLFSFLAAARSRVLGNVLGSVKTG
ncbi:MAG: hypothetical protein AAF889_05885 [Cyanobacteria bacterium P01_D01_bin.73]